MSRIGSAGGAAASPNPLEQSMSHELDDGGKATPARKRSTPLAELKRVNYLLDLVIEGMTSVLLAGIVAINAAEILARLFLDYSLTWVYEINLLLANWLYFLGICLVYYRGRDIAVEFFFERLSAAHQRMGLLVVHSVVIGVFGVLAWVSVPLLELQAQSSSMGLGIPNQWFSMPVFVGAVVMALFVIADLADVWRGAKAGRTAPP